MWRDGEGKRGTRPRVTRFRAGRGADPDGDRAKLTLRVFIPEKRVRLQKKSDWSLPRAAGPLRVRTAGRSLRVRTDIQAKSSPAAPARGARKASAARNRSSADRGNGQIPSGACSGNR